MIGFTSLEARSRNPKIELGNQVTHKLDQVLLTANDLRKAIVEKQDALVITKIRELSQILAEAHDTPDVNSENKAHLNRILKEAKSSLERFQTRSGNEKREHLQETFRQIVLIGQTYKVSQQFKYFFCKSDRSVWLQKESKPLNPINPDKYLNCGMQVQ